MKAFSHLAVGAMLLATLAGCGTQGNLAAAPKGTETLQVESTAGLRGAFTRIHKAIFTHMDANKDGWLDEVEVGGRMTLKEFEKADKSQGWQSAGRLSRTEFVNWATTSFLWFKDDAKSFTTRFRKDLGTVFSRLDENDDRLLEKNELSNRDLAKLKLNFSYDKLRIHVPIKKVNVDRFGGADKTGDGKLSQAEFEDMYLEMVIEALGGDGSAPQPPAPAPSEQPAPPAGK